MNILFRSSLAAPCLLAVSLALPVPALAELSSTRMSPGRVPPPAETQRLRALGVTFAAVRPLAIDQAAVQKLAASPANLPPRLNPAQVAALNQIGQSARRGDQAMLRQRWGAFAAGLPMETTPSDVNALVQWVLREAYQQQMEDLRSYADKVKYFNEIKKQIREEIGNARSMRSAAKAQGSVTMQVVTKWPEYRTGALFPPTITRQKQTLTASQLDRYIETCESMLRSLSDDAQLANIDLQNNLQKQQQVVQMIANIAKLLNDTLQEIIRKIGG